MTCNDCAWRRYDADALADYCGLPNKKQDVDSEQNCPYYAERLAALQAQIGEGHITMSWELAERLINECRTVYHYKPGNCTIPYGGCDLIAECQAVRAKLEALDV